MSISCSCISICVEEGPDDWDDIVRVSGKERQCVECSREIGVGEEYEHSSGTYWDEDERPVEVKHYITCIDCASMRNAFFCDGWFIGRTWDDLGEHLADVVKFGDGVSSDCMMSLTKPARDDVCDMVEDIWKDQDE
jgi:hypothetical protein